MGNSKDCQSGGVTYKLINLHRNMRKPPPRGDREQTTTLMTSTYNFQGTDRNRRHRASHQLSATLIHVLVNTPQSQTSRFTGRPSLISSSTAPLFPELEHPTNLSGYPLQNKENTTFFSGLLSKLNEGRNHTHTHTPRIHCLAHSGGSIRVSDLSLPNGQ